MRIIVASTVFAASVSASCAIAMEADHIKTQTELNAATQTCSGDNLCLHNVMNRAFPLTPELDRSTRGFLGLEYLILSIRASQQLGANDAVDLLTVSIEHLDDLFSSRKYARYISATLHLYRAERCREAQLDDCFLESSDQLIQREIALRSANELRRAQLSEPYKWSEIKAFPEDRNGMGGKRLEDSFAEMGDALELLHPDGTDYRERLDRVLTAAEGMKN